MIIPYFIIIAYTTSHVLAHPVRLQSWGGHSGRGGDESSLSQRNDNSTPQTWRRNLALRSERDSMPDVETLRAFAAVYQHTRSKPNPPQIIPKDRHVITEYGSGISSVEMSELSEASGASDLSEDHHQKRFIMLALNLLSLLPILFQFLPHILPGQGGAASTETASPAEAPPPVPEDANSALDSLMRRALLD